MIDLDDVGISISLRWGCATVGSEISSHQVDGHQAIIAMKADRRTDLVSNRGTILPSRLTLKRGKHFTKAFGVE